MDLGHICLKCNSHMAEVDPHQVCKNCRQPDPQMFYCFGRDCSACKEIKSCKPLEDLLHKYELKKMAKKCSVVYKSLSKKPNEPTHSPESKANDRRIENDNIEDFSRLEKRLFEKLVSKFSGFGNTPTKSPTKDSSEYKAPSTSNSFQKEIEDILILLKSDSSNFAESEELYNSALVSLFRYLDSDLFVKQANIEEPIDPIIRLSSKAGDILRASTLLSSPSCATKFVDTNCLSENLDTWPIDLKISNVLNLHSENIRIKAHPKVRHLQGLLFGKLEPSLPRSIIGPNFSLPCIPVQLQQELIFARGQLHRMLLLYSILDNFSTFKDSELKDSDKAFLLILMNQIELSMVNQANFVGLLVQEIRKVLLAGTVCKVPDAITKLITGPIHSSQFFGMYVFDLEKIINVKGPSFCIFHKLKKCTLEIPELPFKFFENTKSPSKCLKLLNEYFVINQTNDSDKLLLLKSLIPKYCLSNFLKFTKSCNSVTYEQLSELFLKYGGDNYDLLTYRRSFSARIQGDSESVEEFAKSLTNLVVPCSFGHLEKEMLRDKFVFGLRDEKFTKYLLKKPLWLINDCLDWVKTQGEESKSIIGNEPPLKKRKSNDYPNIVIDETSPKKNNSKHFRDVETELGTESLRSVKHYRNMAYHTALNTLASEKNKYIDISNVPIYEQIFPYGLSYQVVCPWTGRLLRE